MSNIYQKYLTAFGEVEVIGLITDGNTIIQGTFNKGTRFGYIVEFKKDAYYFYNDFNEGDMVREILDEYVKNIDCTTVIRIHNKSYVL